MIIINSGRVNTYYEGLWIIDIWSKDTGPCKILGPIAQELENEYKTSPKISSVQAGEPAALAGICKIDKYPVVAIIKDGKLMETIDYASSCAGISSGETKTPGIIKVLRTIGRGLIQKKGLSSTT